jgi:CubicO group peptidase (beta-lactamase class C family)
MRHPSYYDKSKSFLHQFGSPQVFGHAGAGGSFAFADPQRELAFAYAMNRMDYYILDDPREKALRDAVYACIGEKVKS